MGFRTVSEGSHLFVDLSKIDHARIDAHWEIRKSARRELTGFIQGRLLANPQIFR
jgi:hypothetical protein